MLNVRDLIDRIPADTRLHLKFGLLAALGLLLVLALGRYSLVLAELLGGAAFAYGVERYQAIRREGTPELRDMAASFAPFLLLALITGLVL